MIRTADAYCHGLRDGREIWIDNQRVTHVTTPPAFKPTDRAGHRMTFVQVVHAPHLDHPAAVYDSFDFAGPLDLVCKAVGLSDKVTRPV